MPPRRNKRRFEQDEEMDKAEGKSKWATVLEHKEEEEEQHNAEALYHKDKAIFDFDFSKEHLLLHQKQPPKKEEPVVQLTPEEIKIIEERLEKERVEKEEKEKIKKQKRMERKKKINEEKETQRIKKEEEIKQQEQLEKKIKSQKGNNDSKKIMYCLMFVLIFLGVLQYQRDIYNRLSKFRLDTEINYYEVLQISTGVTDSELRNQYKKLVMKYHPDKNPNCHTCTQKFNAIMQAWEVLGNPQKRKHYDQSSGYITQIHSQTITLTTDNYAHLLSDSDDLWIIQVLDSTNSYCHYFASFWEDTATKHNQIARFARIDIWQQPEMKSYIPYKFQLFPGLYSVQGGIEQLCQLDFDRPVRGIEQCIELRVAQPTFTKIKSQAEAVEDSRKAVLVGGGVKLSTKLKLLHNKYSRYFVFYIMDNAQNSIKIKNGDMLQYSGKNNLQLYEQFLLAHTIQRKSMCEVHYLCKNNPCLLLLQKNTAFKPTTIPIVELKEWEEFTQKIDHIKNMTGLFERFELGMYKDGKIDLGNFDEIEDLSSEQGEVIDFICVEQTWLRAIVDWTKSIISK